MNAKYYFKHHRIQDSKAIISLVLHDQKPLCEGGRLLEWTGDAYMLRNELDAVIALLEAKQKNGVYK